MQVVDTFYPFSSYCGAPPQPNTLWERWNFDPALLATLAAALIVYVVCDWRGRARPGLSSRDRLCFYAGFAVAAFALVSPLCALSVSLFSARVGQHLVLTTLAAPLIALGLPRLQRSTARVPLLAAAGFAIALWVWHSPSPYASTFTSDLAYWLMHATTIGAAIFFWSAVIGASRTRLGVSIVAVLATSLQMALLGAVITFAPRALYSPHLLTASDWGMSPLQDQQLGGVLMWAPAGLIFVLAIVTPLGRLLRREASPYGVAVA